MTIYDYSVKDNKGKLVNLSNYKGKVLLIVNTATGCGFTPQYDGLQSLYDKYKEKGLEILDFPCNQFGNQAPGTEDDIAFFCDSRYGITFRQFAKVDVNGEKAEPLFKYLKKQHGGFLSSNIKWNFTKFLIDRNGVVLKRFGSTVTPEKIEKHIQALL